MVSKVATRVEEAMAANRAATSSQVMVEVEATVASKVATVATRVEDTSCISYVSRHV